MFYEEKIINGVLCARIFENGEWTPCNPAQITFRLEEALARVKELQSLEQSLVKHRIAVSPEYEGGFQAHVYGDEENPVSHGVGNSPSEAVAAAIASWSRV